MLMNDNQEGLASLFSLRALLSGCFISDSYAVDPGLTNAMEFTTAGEKEIQAIVRRQPKTRVVDARMLAFLEFDGQHGFHLDQSKTDIRGLQTAISEGIKKRQIQFPWVYGRTLLDTIVSDYGIKGQLNPKETTAVLKKTPVGVFQTGFFTVGPFGCLKSPEFRLIGVPRSIGKFLEVRGEKRVSRKVYLSTGRSATIHRISEANDKLKAKEGIADTPTRQELHELVVWMADQDVKGRHFSDEVFRLLGETLLDHEARSVLVNLLPMIFKRESGSRNLEKALNRVLGDPEKFAGELNRQEIQQIFHLALNSELYLALEGTIACGQIVFAKGASRFSEKAESSTSLRLEMSESGVRNAAKSAQSLFAENALDLFYSIFVDSGFRDAADLRYKLNSTERDTDILIRHALKLWTPMDIVDYLCGDFQIANYCARRVGIFEPANLTSEQIRRKLIYKLGLPLGAPSGEQEDLNNFLLELSAADPNNPKQIKAISVNLFSALETLLFDALTFMNWALIEPKKAQKSSFEFNLDEARNSGTKLTLSPLIEGLAKLRNDLAALPFVEATNDMTNSRSRNDVRQRVFRFKSMYHNLNDSSKDLLLASLVRAYDLLSQESITRFRNNTHHGNSVNEFTSSEILSTVSALQSAVDLLSETGMIPTKWDYWGTEIDNAGFTRIKYKNGKNEVAFELPAHAIAPGLTSQALNLYILKVAELRFVGPLRFTAPELRLNEDYWFGYPPELVIERVSLATPESDEQSDEAA
jgi:hypothetical protein